MTSLIQHRLWFLIFFCCHSLSASSQDVPKNKMKQLDYLVGEWIGTSSLYKEGEISKQGSAFEKISYDLDSTIIVIELNSEFLQLHTIIRYDEADRTYYYYPFSKGGTNRYPATYRDGQLVVKSSATKRFIFSSTDDGGFREYGEELIDGAWIKYFEDVFQDTQ